MGETPGFGRSQQVAHGGASRRASPVPAPACSRASVASSRRGQEDPASRSGSGAAGATAVGV